MTIYGTMFDSPAGAYPAGAALCAYYVNGRYARPPVYARGKVWIDVLANAPTKALFLDVETGDAAPASVPGWLDARRKAGLGTGGIYCDQANLTKVESAANGRPHLLWIATLDGNIAPAVKASGQLVAVQAFPAAMLGFDADMSVVVDKGWWADRALG